MRAEIALRVVAAAAVISGALVAGPMGVALAAGPAAVPRVAAPADSVLPAPPAADSASAGAPAVPSIVMHAERKLGAASLADAVRLRRAAIAVALPLSGPTQGSLLVPGGGGPLRLDGAGPGFEGTTDEPLIGSVALGWGAPSLAFALNDPGGDPTDALDLDAIEFPVERASFRGPGEALSRPIPKGPVFGAARMDTAGGSKTTLLYQKGTGNGQLTGIRFQTTAFHRRFYASYGRNQANGWTPLKETESARYELRAELGRVGGHRFDLEGSLYERTIEDSAGTPPERGGESEWDRRHLALSAVREASRSSDALRIRLSSEKETWIQSSDLNLSPEAGSRERWEFPAVGVDGSATWRATSALTWVASIEAASRKVLFRADSLPAFEPRRGQARVHAGSRFALGSGAGAGLDAAYDVREAQPGFWDARASVWGKTRHVRGRLDLESANDRPSYMDLFTPPRLRALFSSPGYPFQASEIFRSGNPGLKPRRLTGAIGSAGFDLFEGFTVECSGSYRRVTDDFGWNVSADTSGGVYRVSSVAGARGSGRLSHGAIGWEFRRGAIRSRGVGWIRGGPDSLSPRSGSPPRRAIDAAVELKLVLFQGDLPLRLGVESHARGPRRGLIRETGVVTWDGSLSADFGSAGAYVRVRDAFDRRPGSAMWDPTLPDGAAMPGRIVQAGVTWNLLD